MTILSRAGTEGLLRETWVDWLTKAVWEHDGRMWIKIGYRRVAEYKWNLR